MLAQQVPVDISLTMPYFDSTRRRTSPYHHPTRFGFDVATLNREAADALVTVATATNDRTGAASDVRYGGIRSGG
jgi:hypothetical protein